MLQATLDLVASLGTVIDPSPIVTDVEAETAGINALWMLVIPGALALWGLKWGVPKAVRFLASIIGR